MKPFQPVGRLPLLSSILLVAAAAALVRPVLGEDAPKLYVEVGTQNRYSYSGDPARVSVLLKNEGTAPWTNPGVDFEAGFEVYGDDAKKLEKVKQHPSAHDAQPKILEPSGYFGKIIDIGPIFPKMSALGSYRITWSAPGIPEQSVVLRIIKKYDPKLDYQGVIDTDFGKVVIEFYKDLAPFHVRNFIDLSNLGFYDGKLFHRILKNEMILGGSATGDERGSPGYTIPPEPNGLKILPGVVAQVRNSMTGAEESGSIFLIAANPQPDMDSRVTVFARVVEGLDTVKAISGLPTISGAARVPSRPIKDVAIKKIEIREKKSSKKS
jgi:cyclophilin family peptidyl-prolyl cis-trans isomerase